MRAFNQLVFDETVHTSAPSYTSSDFHDLLGRADNLALQAVIDDVVITGGAEGVVQARLEHSSDGLFWASKNPGLDPEVYRDGVNHGTMAVVNGADSSTNASLARGRLRIEMSVDLVGETGSAHLKIYACGREAS